MEMNDRRRFVVALGASAMGISLGTFAQAPTIRRIGLLRTGALGPPEFVQELERLGYVQGKNISLIVPSSHSHSGGLPAMASELVAERVDVIVTGNTISALAARAATTSIPIVFYFVSDPVGSGLVQSLARPGYNMTGTTHLNAELAAKRLEILKELSPKMSRLAVFTSDEPHALLQLEQVQIGAKQLGISIQTVKVLRREDFESVEKKLRGWRANAIFVVDSVTNASNAKLMAEFSAQLRLPAMYARDRYTHEGGLASYGVNSEATYRRAAYYVDRILKGAKPAELPVELPTQYELVINMKTAKALGFKVPQSLLARADRVIE